MHCLIVGGGLSGLSAAVYLAKEGVKSTIIEASPKLGGKAYSFYSKKINLNIDNGQHLMLGCYNNTLDFIDTISANDKIEIIKKVDIPFISSTGRTFLLKSSSNIYPLNLMSAFYNFELLSIKDKVNFGFLFFDIMIGKNLSGLSINEWLIKTKQTQNSILVLWEPLVVSIFNCNLESASAEMFKDVLKEMFFSKNGFNFIIPKVPLSDLFSVNAEKYLKNKGNKIILSERVENIVLNEKKLEKIVTNKSIYTNFDKVIFAVPTYSLQPIIKQYKDVSELDNFEYSPIISTFIKIKENILEKKYYALTNSPIHWVFNKNNYISLVTSNAKDLIDLKDDVIFNIFKNELKKYFPFIEDNDFLDYQIIKEKRATFILNEKLETIRAKFTLENNNVYFAGDWTNTGLPSTIESAIKSGKTTAKTIINSL
ncbi:MAG: hydroxysqualene dehydroxylase HpnE [bacterium]